MSRVYVDTEGLPPEVRGAVRRLLDETLAHWVILRTSPPAAMNRETGELIDLPEPPEVRCGACRRWHG
jgi:hypothetical protein